MRKMFAFMCIACAFSLLSACSLKKMTTHTVGEISTDGSAILESENDVEIARESSIPLIKSLEVFSAGDKKDARYLTLLAKSYGQYAFGFLEEDMLREQGRDEYKKARDRADSFYARGKNYGLRALESKGGMKAALNGPQTEMEKALSGMGKKDLPTLFWSGFCWGNWLNLHRDDPNAFIETPRVQALMERVVAVNPSYNYGGALSALGVIHASRPAMLGGDAKKSREFFDRAIETSPNYLMHKVLMAQYLAVQTQDRALFKKLLNEVLSSGADSLPEQRLANELAKRRAAILLEKEKSLF